MTHTWKGTARHSPPGKAERNRAGQHLALAGAGGERDGSERPADTEQNGAAGGPSTGGRGDGEPARGRGSVWAWAPEKRGHGPPTPGGAFAAAAPTAAARRRRLRVTTGGRRRNRSPLHRRAARRFAPRRGRPSTARGHAGHARRESPRVTWLPLRDAPSTAHPRGETDQGPPGAGAAALAKRGRDGSDR